MLWIYYLVFYTTLKIFEIFSWCVFKFPVSYTSCWDWESFIYYECVVMFKCFWNLPGFELPKMWGAVKRNKLILLFVMFKRIRVAKSNVPPFEALECECLAFILTDDKINDGERKKWKKFKFTKRIKQKLRKTKAACCSRFKVLQFYFWHHNHYTGSYLTLTYF